MIRYEVVCSVNGSNMIIQCDSFNMVMGKCVTERYMDKDKDIIRSWIIPKDKVIEIREVNKNV